MNTVNVSLQVLATGLVALGVQTIGSNLVEGAVEVLLGIVLYVVYEFVPSK